MMKEDVCSDVDGYSLIHLKSPVVFYCQHTCVTQL